MGPPQGMLDTARQADTPTMAAASGEQSRSTLITVQVTTTSLRKSPGKRGRMDRSITRLARTAGREGCPSLRRKEPGMRPTA